MARIPKDEIKTSTPTTRRGDSIDILPRPPEPLLFLCHWFKFCDMLIDVPPLFHRNLPIAYICTYLVLSFILRTLVLLVHGTHGVNMLSNSRTNYSLIHKCRLRVRRLPFLSLRTCVYDCHRQEYTYIYMYSSGRESHARVLIRSFLSENNALFSTKP